MCKFLLFLTLFFILSCSAGNPPESGNQKPSGEKKEVTSAPQDKGVSGNKAPYSSEIPIKEEKEQITEKVNTPPEIKTIKIVPERFFKPEDRLGVEVSADDTDGDEVAILYEWTKNGRPAGNDKWIEGSLKRGDKVSVRITPFDGRDYGRSMLLEREILNFPPLIMESKDFNFDGKVYQQQIKASDPDGDMLTFKLSKAPEGMRIDEGTGLITWTVDDKVQRRFPVQVSVTDGHGGEGIYSFDVTIQ